MHEDDHVHVVVFLMTKSVTDEQTNGGKWIIVQYSVRLETAIENH